MADFALVTVPSFDEAGEELQELTAYVAQDEDGKPLGIFLSAQAAWKFIATYKLQLARKELHRNRCIRIAERDAHQEDTRREAELRESAMRASVLRGAVEQRWLEAESCSTPKGGRFSVFVAQV